MKLSKSLIRWLELSGGTFVGQALIIAFLPYITLSLGTINFGHYVILSSFAAAITSFSTFRYELLLFKGVKSKDESLIFSAMLVSFFFCFFVVPFSFYWLNKYGLNLEYLNIISENLLNLCINLFLLSFNNIFFYVSLKKNNFRHISISKIAQPLAFV